MNKKIIISGILLLGVVLFFVFATPGNQNVSNNRSTSKQKTAPEATFTTIKGDKINVSAYQGEKLMIWIFATWCPSCKAGAKALVRNREKLSGMNVLAVRAYRNAGNKGPSASEFAHEYASQTLQLESWKWGDVPASASQKYNPKHYPDIYYLINENGEVVEVKTAPAATIDNILTFAQK